MDVQIRRLLWLLTAPGLFLLIWIGVAGRPPEPAKGKPEPLPIPSATPPAPSPPADLISRTPARPVNAMPFATNASLATNAPFATNASLATNAPFTTPSPPAMDPLPTSTSAAVDRLSPPDWLIYLNHFRRQSGLPLLEEASRLSEGAYLHSAYMARNDSVTARTEKQDNPLFSEAGRTAAQNGNIFAMQNSQANYLWAINFWMSAPFHAIGILDPQLRQVGYGNFRDDLGMVKVAAVLDVESDLDEARQASYPVYYPPAGGETWILRQTLLEYPDPLSQCPGYHKPVGPPILLQLGPGGQPLAVTGHALMSDGMALESCRIYAGNYTNPDPYAQERGRRLLAERDAIVIIPREPLGVGRSYTAEVTVNGQAYRWSFAAIPPPTIAAAQITPSADVLGWPTFNVNSLQWGGQTHDLLFPGLMRDMGMGWLKFQQKWRADSRPEELAGRIQLAHSLGFKVLVSLTGDPYPRAIEFEAFTEFLGGVARLRPAPEAIEVWNEMNLDFEWPAGQIDPAGYVDDMLRPAYQAIKSANPSIMVISGALAPTGFDNQQNVWSTDHYLEGMVEAGATNYLDCVGVHYNQGATSPYDESGHPAGPYYGWYYQPSLASTFLAFGAARPLCLTELGFLSGDGYQSLPANYWWAQQTTVEQQARWLAEALTIANNLGYVRLAIVFNVDIFQWERDPQGGYAIVRPGGSCPFCRLIIDSGR